MAITVAIDFLGYLMLPRGQSKEGVLNNKQGMILGVVLAEFHRVWPLAGLTLAMLAAVGWIGLLGYVVIKLF